MIIIYSNLNNREKGENENSKNMYDKVKHYGNWNDGTKYA